MVLVKAKADQLAASLDVLNDLAEIRGAKSVALHQMTPAEQAQAARVFVEGLRAAPSGAPAVCILDTGVNRHHPLLAASLADGDLHACDPAWRTDDNHGHGTEMAGLALLGDLSPIAKSAAPPVLRHRLESVKILSPGQGYNPPHLYGAITAEATSRVEVQAPERRRGFSMAVTRNADGLRGQPTSWSAAIDALAASRSLTHLPGGWSTSTTTRKVQEGSSSSPPGTSTPPTSTTLRAAIPKRFTIRDKHGMR